MKLSWENRTLAYSIWYAILDYFPPSKHHRKNPRLFLLYDPDMGFGFWDYPENGPGGQAPVGVNFWKCQTLEELIGTMLHEFWHHCQNPNRTDEEKYEAEADAFAFKHWRKFVPLDYPHNPEEPHP